MPRHVLSAPGALGGYRLGETRFLLSTRQQFRRCAVPFNKSYSLRVLAHLVEPADHRDYVLHLNYVSDGQVERQFATNVPTQLLVWFSSKGGKNMRKVSTFAQPHHRLTE
jgi:hypothetical protein